MRNPVIMKHALRTALLWLFTMLFLGTSPLWGRPVGKFYYRGAPEGINADTVMVSDTIVAMAEKVFVKNTFYTDSINDTPAICFIIDHSTSMSYAYGDTSRDPAGNRFLMTSALIDTVYKKYPTAEIGYIVFKDGLFYAYSDVPDIFGQYTGATIRNDGYMPLKKLNEQYGTELGITILKSYLLTRDSIVNGFAYKELLYRPSTWPTEGTNITLAFNAAKQVLAASTRPIMAHAIIFISDGEHTSGGTDYVQGTGCPTTLTVFFTRSQTVPANLVNMTTNIKRNFPKSALWPFYNSDFNALMSLVSDSIYPLILQSIAPHPRQLTIGTQTVSLWSPADSTFAFSSLFPLAGATTPFNYLIRYPRPAGDTIHAVSFNAQTQGGFRRTDRDSLVYILWDRDLAFQSTAGVTLTTVSRGIDSIQIRFEFTPTIAPGNANYHYTQAAVELFNTHPTIRDREILPLARGAGYFFTGKIKRVVAAAGVPLDNMLQHAASNDTLIAVFRNNQTPRLPLDTLRDSIPFIISTDARILSAATKDHNGNGYIDAINMAFDFETSLASTETSGYTVRYGAATLPVGAVERTPGGTPRQWRLLIVEPAPAEPLQTFWTPALQTSQVERIDDMTVTCIDSVAPVVYRAVKVIADSSSRHNDTVNILFSEKIRGPDGVLFSIANAPTATFAVWLGNTPNSADTLLANIANFDRIVGDSILCFRMTNGLDLNANHWVNINSSSIILRDVAGNTAASNNRKVRVEIQTVSAIGTFPKPAEISRVTIIGKGSSISLEGIRIPSDPNIAQQVTLTMKMFDAAGRTVAAIKPAKLFANRVGTGSSVNLYWDGFNGQCGKLAPGVYFAEVTIDYPPASRISTIRTLRPLGIRQ